MGVGLQRTVKRKAPVRWLVGDRHKKVGVKSQTGKGRLAGRQAEHTQCSKYMLSVSQPRNDCGKRSTSILR